MFPIQRFTRSAPAASSQDEIPNFKRKWSNLLPLLVALVVLLEIVFLGRLDIAHNSALVNSVAESFYHFTTSTNQTNQTSNCEDWLQREDALDYSRNFSADPILVRAPPQEFPSCAVGCIFSLTSTRKHDAMFGISHDHDVAGVLRSMESSEYYAENNLVISRRMGFNITMTTSLSSTVPVGYFSWAEYDIMAPLEQKNETALAAAFISNCAARNFRLKALRAVEKAGVKVDSFGSCLHNRDGKGQHFHQIKAYI
jgi:glycoprotein 3-alpha-L-fucosyltransferase